MQKEFDIIAETASNSSNDIFNASMTDDNHKIGNPEHHEVKRKLFIGKNIIMDYYKKVIWEIIISLIFYIKNSSIIWSSG